MPEKRVCAVLAYDRAGCFDLADYMGILKVSVGDQAIKPQGDKTSSNASVWRPCIFLVTSYMLFGWPDKRSRQYSLKRFTTCNGVQPYIKPNKALFLLLFP